MASDHVKVLVTGGFGALGINLVQALHARGDADIHVLDDLSAGAANFTPSVAFTHLDIGNAEKVSAFCRHHTFDVIYHLAAHFANQNSVDHPISDATTNIVGTINLFEAQRANERLRKIVYASSSCVYGDSPEMSEDGSVRPWDTPYAINKYAGELYARYYASVHSIPVATARIFNSYGPGEMPGLYRNVIPNFIAKALRGEDLVITGTGDETRDFTYVTDTVQLLLRLADSTYHQAEIFNGGTGAALPIKMIATKIIAMTNSRSRIVYAAPRNWDHIKHRVADTQRTRSLLGHQPTVPFDEGLTATIDWVRHALAARHDVS